jgi:hypothetical protein
MTIVVFLATSLSYLLAGCVGIRRLARRFGR